MGKRVQGAGISQGSLQDLSFCRERGQGVRGDTGDTDLPHALHSLPHIPPPFPTLHPDSLGSAFKWVAATKKLGLVLSLPCFLTRSLGMRALVAEDPRQPP